ncbi:hypothetical protein [Azospirillum picis]|uniref:Uncharacterized protein n=1 Tax=Azospirillum picis TaxID=488438 RepID=A0ABU0MUY4_9PROT|nr:hypothetical protein [Azospirillum picis]MBP2303449.1 hypothetical protein [Azospirillum picis]MDQ0537292.1 hypothetical protein [Azospirillum picis]
MAPRTNVSYKPVISRIPSTSYSWVDPEGDGKLIRTSFEAGGNPYVWTAERVKANDDICLHIGQKYGWQPTASVFFIKFDNAFNQIPNLDGPPRDFAKTTQKDLDLGKRWNTRGSINALFSHVTSATLSFMELHEQRVVFAVGNDENLHEYYKQTFVANPRPDIGIAVDEMAGEELYLPHDSYLVLRCV